MPKEILESTNESKKVESDLVKILGIHNSIRFEEEWVKGLGYPTEKHTWVKDASREQEEAAEEAESNLWSNFPPTRHLGIRELGALTHIQVESLL